jgi:hypothetical protein
MKKALVVGLMILALAGCADVTKASQDAVATLSSPPQQILELIKEAAQWLLSIFGNFLGDLVNPLFKALGL